MPSHPQLAVTRNAHQVNRLALQAMQAINNNSKEAKNTEPGFAAFVENRSA